MMGTMHRTAARVLMVTAIAVAPILPAAPALAEQPAGAPAVQVAHDTGWYGNPCNWGFNWLYPQCWFGWGNYDGFHGWLW